MGSAHSPSLLSMDRPSDARIDIPQVGNIDMQTNLSNAGMATTATTSGVGTNSSMSVTNSNKTVLPATAPAAVAFQFLKSIGVPAFGRRIRGDDHWQLLSIFARARLEDTSIESMVETKQVDTAVHSIASFMCVRM